jgi:hypothetical protein
MAAITGWEVDDWPFCLSKHLDFYTIIFKEDGSNGVDVYEAYCGTDDAWDATQVIDAMTTINVPTVYPINIDFADFGWFYAMAYAEISSGSLGVYCYIREPGIGSATTAVRALPTDNCPEFISCCNFKGQPILGGIISTDKQWTQLGSCSVVWGAVGQWEFRPNVNRTAGYIKMPWSDWDEGLVHKVTRLGNNVMVYGNGGRAALKPYTQNLATGFGLVDEVNGTGINKGFHMAGDSQLHGFVDTNNEFWVVESGPKFTKMGYKEWFTDLLDENKDIGVGTPMIVSYDPSNRRFYIGGYSSAYVLTEWGLYSTHQSITGVGNYRGNVLCGFFKDLGDYEGRFQIADIDFKQRGLKTVEHVELGVDYSPVGSERLSVGVDTKYSHSEEVREGNWVRMNKEGVGYLGKTAVDFRVKVKVGDYRDGDPKFDSLKVRFKMVDKRSIRGMYDADIGG